MRPPFRYSLEALIKKHSWELESVRIQEKEKRNIKDARQKQCADIEAMIAEIETELRHAHASDSQINPDAYRALTVYLNDRRSELGEAKNRFDEAAREHEGVVRQVMSIKRSLRALEKHRAGKEAEFRLEQDRNEMRTADELWLLKTGGRKK